MWCCSHPANLLEDARVKGLADVVIAAVPLLDPNYRRHVEDKTLHPEGAVLVDLAVRRAGVSRVYLKYGVIDFVPMSDQDPVVLVHQGKDMEEKRIAAYRDISARYSRYLGEVCPKLNPMAKVWTAERLAGFENTISDVQPLQVRNHSWSMAYMLILSDHTNLLSELQKPPLGDHPGARSWRSCQRSNPTGPGWSGHFPSRSCRYA